MASEVQRIISLSLNKIMASRSRRGGISLHRNLLVASVLLRAKDAYVAETVAKRKLELDNEALEKEKLECREEELSEAMEDMDCDIQAQAVSEEMAVDKESERDNKDLGLLDEFEEQEDKSCETGEMLNDSDEFCKENVDPDSNSDNCKHCLESDSMDYHKKFSCPTRKRHFSELERAVISIGGQSDSTSTDRCEDCCVILSCSNNNTCTSELSHCKRRRFDNNENTYTSTELTSSDDVLSRDDILNTKTKSVSESWNSFESHRSIDLSTTHKVSMPLGLSCGSPSELNIFTSQVSLSRPNLLVATI